MEIEKPIRLQIAKKIIEIFVPSMFVAVILLFFNLIIFDTSQPTRVLIIVTISLISLYSLRLSRKNRIWLATKIFVYSAYIILLIGMILNGGVFAPSFFALGIIVSIVAWLYPSRFAYSFVGITIILTGAIMVLELNGMLVSINTPSPEAMWITICIIITLIAMTSIYPNKMLHEALLKSEKSKEEILKAKQRIESADKLKTEFLSQVSHEIRTPLNSIISFSNLLRLETGKIIPEDLARGFSIIERSGERIIRTIDLLINMSQVITNSYEAHFSKIDIVELIQTVIFEQRQKITKDIKLNLITNLEKCFVSLDHYSFTQILNNLVDNAIKFTNEGRIDIKLDKYESKITLNVEDTGIGITKEFIEEIFTPFSQESKGYSRSYEGNGLGMSLVKEFCKLNNIEVFISSEKNIGTTVSLHFSAA